MLPPFMPTFNPSALGPYTSPASLRKLQNICQKFPEFYGNSESLPSSKLPAILREEIHTVPENPIPITSILMLFSLQFHCFQICLFFQAFLPEAFTNFYSLPFVPCALPILYQ